MQGAQDSQPEPDRTSQAGNLVANARTRAGISQRELARRAGVPGPVVNAIERSRRQPSIPTLAKVLGGLGLDLQLHAVPTGAGDGNEPPKVSQVPPLSERVISVRFSSEAERVRARRIYNALTLADSIKRSKRRERAHGIR